MNFNGGLNKPPLKYVGMDEYYIQRLYVRRNIFMF